MSGSTPEPEPEPGISLHWIPLGAGGVGYVRLNGRVYEAVAAAIGRRKRLQLVHTALQVQVPEGRFIIENAWPSPDADIESRGVVFEGPVFSRRLSRWRPLRYEVRCWRDGIIPDVDQSIGGPRRLSGDLRRARLLVDLVASVPRRVWGRRESSSGEMWNSNSVISWLLARSGIDLGSIRPPSGSRAPGWNAGIEMARRDWTPPASRRRHDVA